MRAHQLAVALVLGLPISFVRAQYTLKKTYQGSSFFDDWTFYGNFDDTNNGHVIYLNRQDAFSQKLVSITQANNAIIRVDNFTTLPITSPTLVEKRNSVRINTNDLYGVGSLWVADFAHVPYGCGVWGAFWSTPTNTSINFAPWPTGGEIDTFESWNLIQDSHYTLHTIPGCTVTNPSQTSSAFASMDCSAGNPVGAQGCSSNSTDQNTVGPNFSNVGGGIWITELASTGISIWFFERANIPQSLKGNATSLDTSTFGTPAFNVPSTSCNVGSVFKPQSLIFDITLCGEADYNQTQTCASRGACLQNTVWGNGSNFDEAYFEIQSIKVFQSTTTASGGSSAGSTAPQPTSSAGATSSGSTSTSGALALLATSASASIYAVVGAAMFLAMLSA
ncbi:hypothetical protein K488DRAFT_52606 [Vararia minispora EC-137]|uniref:Uncharacterized protein n=1 Tax=Vararia minispora EC-137 TaxID=1314806 RepID=A0ACB8QH97_9AGAM|nr:hypothetical protein K488DRAFT_52606 [Vararia minispora EC-137]